MKPFAASLFVASLLCSFNAFGQSPIQVKYCQDLAATYRKSIASGKSPVAGVGQAIADCPTNPNESIPTLEGALKQLKVDLPPR